jgi:hypothetical protein
MFRLFQAAALHGRTSESSAYVAEARNELGFASEAASEVACVAFKMRGAIAARE